MTECNSTNCSEITGPPEEISSDDCAWILSNAFLILTMQSGFGLLEAGCVSAKNVANIMVKNVVDVTLGGVTYWSFGYGLSFGEPSNWFCGWGNWFFTANNVSNMGTMYTKYFFQLSFATAATTIVSGAIAERMKLSAYIVFSVINTFVYCFPVAWTWNSAGFLAQVGFFDFAGSCVVHMTGGISALAAATILGPRLGRFTEKDNYVMSSPVTALTGTFMLWWAWLGFNCGSTFGIDGHLWKIAAKVGVTTLNGSIGGSIAALSLSLIVSRGQFYDITYLINGILGGLVGVRGQLAPLSIKYLSSQVTACCAVISPAESILIGAIGAAIAVLATHGLEWIKVDDPVGAVPVHACAGMWSTIAVGLFGQDDFGLLGGRSGLFRGGGWYLLGIQTLGCAILGVWSFVLTTIVFYTMKYTIGIRMSPEEEILGADWVEHKVRSITMATKLESALQDVNVKDQEMADVIKKVVAQLGDTSGQQRNISPRIRNMTGERALSPSVQGGMMGGFDESGMRGIPNQSRIDQNMLDFLPPHVTDSGGPSVFSRMLQAGKQIVKKGTPETSPQVGTSTLTERPKSAWSED